MGVRTALIAKFLHKRKWWIVALTLMLTALAVCCGIAIWVDPPIEYYERWMWKHELREQAINPISCVQNPIADWYRQLAQILPVPSTFICFNTETEANIWMRENIH